MKWQRRDGAMVPEKDPVEAHADAAAREFGFNEAERAEFLKVQRALYMNPSLRKKLAKRQRRFALAAGMSPSIKSRRSR